MPRLTKLQKILAVLADRQGEIDDGPPRDAWHAVLWENVVAPADAARRPKAFALLQSATGLDAARLDALAPAELQRICGRGEPGARQAERLRRCAELFSSAGDPRDLVTLPAEAARRELLAFPGIDAAIVDRLRLFAEVEPVAAFDANGLRALLRIGYGDEDADAAATAQSVVAAAADDLPADVEVLIDAWLRLWRHGIETCRRQPLCDACPVQNHCATARGDRRCG